MIKQAASYVLGALLVALFSACAPGGAGAPEALVILRVSPPAGALAPARGFTAQALPGGVATIDVYISADDFATKKFTITGDAALSELIPAGSNRRFIAEAFNADEELLFRGSTVADLADGEIAEIRLDCYTAGRFTDDTADATGVDEDETAADIAFVEITAGADALELRVGFIVPEPEEGEVAENTGFVGFIEIDDSDTDTSLGQDTRSGADLGSPSIIDQISAGTVETGMNVDFRLELFKNDSANLMQAGKTEEKIGEVPLVRTPETLEVSVPYEMLGVDNADGLSFTALFGLRGIGPSDYAPASGSFSLSAPAAE